jgi:hypothetical protein
MRETIRRAMLGAFFGLVAVSWLLASLAVVLIGGWRALLLLAAGAGVLVGMAARLATTDHGDRRFAELVVAAAATAVLVAGLVSSPSVREDVAARKAAVTAFERLHHDKVIFVHRFARFGSCAAAEVEGSRSGYDVVGLLREHGRWAFKGSIGAYGDLDEVTDEEVCREAVRGASPG